MVSIGSDECYIKIILISEYFILVGACSVTNENIHTNLVVKCVLFGTITMAIYEILLNLSKTITYFTILKCTFLE